MLIYDDKVKFEYSSKGHRYTVSKHIKDDLWTTPTPTTGITTITAIIAKDALIYWSAKVAAYYMRDNWKQAKSIPALAEVAKVEHKNEKNKSAGIGTVGHKMIEALLKGQEVVMPEKEELKEALKNIRIQHDKFEADLTPKLFMLRRPCTA